MRFTHVFFFFFFAFVLENEFFQSDFPDPRYYLHIYTLG